MSDLFAADHWLFRHINGKWHHPWLDTFLPLVRTSQFWYPLYIFLILLVALNFKQGRWVWIIMFGLTPAVTDFISSDLIKENIFRLRPCNDPAMAHSLRFLLGYKPQSSSFTSSHAANHFAMAAFLFYTLRKFFGKRTFLFFVWAALICWAQVYVGVHYPIDVVAGAMLGFCIGAVFSFYLNKKIQLNY